MAVEKARKISPEELPAGVPPRATPMAARRARWRRVNGDRGASVAITANISADGVLHDPRIVIGGLAPTPWRAQQTEGSLDGKPIEIGTFRAALDRELDRAAHPLPRNGWKLDAASGLAEQALEAVLRAHEAAQAAPVRESA